MVREKYAKPSILLKTEMESLMGPRFYVALGIPLKIHKLLEAKELILIMQRKQRFSLEIFNQGNLMCPGNLKMSRNILNI